MPKTRNQPVEQVTTLGQKEQTKVILRNQVAKSVKWVLLATDPHSNREFCHVIHVKGNDIWASDGSRCHQVTYPRHNIPEGTYSKHSAGANWVTIDRTESAPLPLTLDQLFQDVKDRKIVIPLTGGDADARAYILISEVGTLKDRSKSAMYGYYLPYLKDALEQTTKAILPEIKNLTSNKPQTWAVYTIGAEEVDRVSTIDQGTVLYKAIVMPRAL